MSNQIDFSYPYGHICLGCGVWVSGGEYHIFSKPYQQNTITQKLDGIIAQLEQINQKLQNIIKELQ